MKRTKSINLDRMRKKPRSLALKPLVVAVAASALQGCGKTWEADIYRDVNHCIQDNPGMDVQCEVAYEKALAAAARSGPKYSTARDCSVDFGEGHCVPYRAGGYNRPAWYMPAMAGFLFSRTGNQYEYHSAPLYTSYSRYSPAYGQWSTVDGDLYGKRRYGSIKVGDSTFKPKPPVVKTISRGGFGSTIAAKSSWGGTSSSGSWGG